MTFQIGLNSSLLRGNLLQAILKGQFPGPLGKDLVSVATSKNFPKLLLTLICQQASTLLTRYLLMLALYLQ
ncbi:MAG: hypothetical protein NTY29_08965, partial [Proteobacteria bacterium]|nr:hypothetical protein [Pseudomonadota bacterium]